MPAPLVDTDLAAEAYCYLTTTGRRTGRPHTIEIWFGLHGDTLYMLAGGRERADWVANAIASPDVSVRIGDTTFSATARVLAPDTDEDALARRLLLQKYGSGSGNLDDWGKTALPVALDVTGTLSPDPAEARWPKGRRLG